MKFKKEQIISALLIVTILIVVIILVTNNSKKKERINQQEPKGFSIELVDSSSNATVEVGLTRSLKNEVFQKNLMSRAFFVKNKGNEMPEIRVIFEKDKHPLANSESVIAWWTGEHWQELRTLETNKKITTLTNREGTYVLKKTPNLGILLVHGLGGNNSTWDELIEWRTEKPFYKFTGNFKVDELGGIIFEPEPEVVSDEKFVPLYTINFSDNQNLTFNEQGEEMRIVIEEILTDNKCDKLVLVGHSMGGIACRAYLNKFKTKNIAGYISVTAPHMGSFLASIKRWANDEDYTDDYICDLSSGVKRTLVGAIDILYPRISINAKALDYLEPGSSELNEIHSKEFPDYLPTATITSVWEANFLGNTFIREALTNIAEAFEQKYNPIYSEAQLQKYDMEQRKLMTDGVVCYQSQILESTVPNQKSLNPYHFNTNVFHTKTSKEEIICSAIDSLMLHYFPDVKTRIVTEL